MKDQLKEKIRSLVHEVYYGDVKSDKMDADKVIDQALASILALFPKPMDTKFDEESVEEAIKLLKNFEMYAEISKLDVNEEALYKVSATLISICQSCLSDTLDRPMMSEESIEKIIRDFKEDEAGHKIDKEGLIIYDDRCAICNPAPEKELERKAIAEILFKTENPKFSHYWQDNIKVKEHEGDCVGIHGECRKCEVEHYFELADAILAHKPAPENICLVCQGTKKNTWDEPCSCGEPKSDVPSEFPPEIEDHPDDEVLNAYNNGQNAMRSECIAVAQKLMADKDTLLEGLRQIVKNYQKWQGEDSLKIAKMTCPYKDIKDGSCIKQVAVDSLCEKLEKAEAEIARLEGK